MKAVLVVWLDAWQEQNEVTTADAEAHRGYETHSVGYLVSDTEAGVTLAMDAFPGHPNHYKTHAFIPAGMLVEIIPLRTGPGLDDDE